MLGKTLVRRIGNQVVKGKIVEAEAYAGFDDKASHTHKGQTQRNGIMFGQAGFAYVYFTYGLHYLFNIVTEVGNYPSAVLIRAIEPISGLKFIEENRPGRKFYELTSGPAKLTQALRIDKYFNGTDMTTAETLWLEKGENLKASEIVKGPRVGVRYSEECQHWPWRFFIKDNRFVSKL